MPWMGHWEPNKALFSREVNCRQANTNREGLGWTRTQKQRVLGAALKFSLIPWFQPTSETSASRSNFRAGKWPDL